jgi:hypothetical protein
MLGGEAMWGDEASESEFRERLAAILRATPPLMQVLSVPRHLRLPDWLVFSGAVYQPVLNHLTGRPLDFGIKDSQPSARASLVEAKFGESYTPLSCTAQALECFASATFAVGIRLESDNRLHIMAPFGLADLFALCVVPNPRWKTVGFARASADVQRRWPEVVIDDEPRFSC